MATTNKKAMNEAFDQPFSIEEAEKNIISLAKTPTKKKNVEQTVAKVLADVLTHYPSTEKDKSQKLLRSLVHTCVKKNLDQQLCMLVYQSSQLPIKKDASLDNLRKDTFSYLLKKEIRQQILAK